MFKRKIRNWHIPRNGEITEFDKKILAFQNKGELVPTRELVKTPEQIEGIRRSGVVNTGVLDLIQKEIHVGMSTLEIDQMVYDYTVAHGAIPAPLGYEGFPKSVCTSINEVVCHGIPSADEILEEGDIINVDVSTILDGYYSDASRMFTIGKTSPEKEALVRNVLKSALPPPSPGALWATSAKPLRNMPAKTDSASSETSADTAWDWNSTRIRRSTTTTRTATACCLCRAWCSPSSR